MTGAAYDPSQANIDWSQYQQNVQNFFNQLASEPQFQTSSSANPSGLPWYCSAFGIGCPGGSGTPTWMWAVGATLIGVVALGAIGGRR